MDVAKFPGLRRRPNSSNWYFIVRVPDDIRAAFGRNQVWVSLGTSNRKAAEKAWIEQHAKWMDEFDRIRAAHAAEAGDLEGSAALLQSRVERLRAVRRQRGTSGLPPLDDEAALYLARSWLSEAEHKALFRPPVDDPARALADREADISILRDAGHPDTQRAAQRAADVLLEARGIAGQPGEPGYDRLLEFLRRAMLEVARRDLDRLRSEYACPTHDPLFPVQEPDKAPAVPSGPVEASVKEVAAAFWREKREAKPMDGKTRQKYRAALDLVMAFLGEGTPIGQVTRDQCKRFLALLRCLPPNYAKRTQTVSLAKVIEDAFERQGKGLSLNTRRAYYRQLRDMIDWATAEGYPVACRISDLKVERHVDDGEEEDGRRAFTAGELRTIFAAPLFTGCRDDENGFSREGPNVVRRGRYWLPLLALWTGARLGELCQLRAQDVQRTEDGIPYIEITDQGEGMKVKTRAARRCVPVHPELERLGFLDWVDQRRGAQEEHLFPEVLQPGRPNSYRSSKRFASLLVSLKLDGKETCFHSFRHTFRDALRRARVSEEIAEAIGGWSEGKRTSRMYGDGYIADTLYPDVCQISYPGLDLSHLHQRQPVEASA